MEYVYQEWFPHRARDQDIRKESYFAKLMRFLPPTKTLGEIANFHWTLCGKLMSLEGGILELEPIGRLNWCLKSEDDQGNLNSGRLFPRSS